MTVMDVEFENRQFEMRVIVDAGRWLEDRTGFFIFARNQMVRRAYYFQTRGRCVMTS